MIKDLALEAKRLGILTIVTMAIFLMVPHSVNAQPTTTDNATVTYPAEFFDQFGPVSVVDMLNRIPGIRIALSEELTGTISNNSNSGDRRGLGFGGEQILIDGRRITGKENEGAAQLGRIPADQVSHIEIIRGTSGDLDVRGGTQVINIVLLEATSRSSSAYEVTSTRFDDHTSQLTGKLSFSGQVRNLDYLVSFDSQPGWENRIGWERSILADESQNDALLRDQITDSTPYTFSTNLAYQFNAAHTLRLNGQFSDEDAPVSVRREIVNFRPGSLGAFSELDDTQDSNEFWEIGGDYEYRPSSRLRWKTLFILNERDNFSERERVKFLEEDTFRDLFLRNANLYEEEIVRSALTFGFSDRHSLEVGMERAESTLSSSLQLGLLQSGRETDPRFGDLTPITNSNAVVTEERYEGFAVHNWKLTDRMRLESSLISEVSEISQTGDVSKTRDFDFIRPKLDFRFDITPSLQFRASVEKDVSQLSFNDFTNNVETFDDDLDELSGNPEIRQEQSWRYELNLEYRFNNDNGVINTNLFYHDIEDVIDRVSVVERDGLYLSANGNIGDGERYGLKLDGSLRLASFNLPGILVTSRLELNDSSVIDPFLGIDRRLNRSGRGFASVGLRHDIPTLGINYGFDYRHSFRNNILAYDINRIESFQPNDFESVFVEFIDVFGLTVRFNASTLSEEQRCRVRQRFFNGTIATGHLGEIETACSDTGVEFALTVRSTF